jgi:hypothetical protein
MLTGYDIQLVGNNTETNCTVSYFMKWPADTYRRVSFSEVYNGDLFYDLLYQWEEGMLSNRKYEMQLRRIFRPVLQHSKQKANSVCLPVLTIFTHSSISFDGIKNVVPVSLISI